MTEKQETFAERLARAMAAKGYKQADLIRIAGDRGMKLGKSQVSQYANGKTVPRRPVGEVLADVLAEAGKGELNPAALQGAGNGLIVTPKDIDTQVHDLAKVIGYGINLALHTGLTIEDVELFLS